MTTNEKFSLTTSELPFSDALPISADGIDTADILQMLFWFSGAFDVTGDPVTDNERLALFSFQQYFMESIPVSSDGLSNEDKRQILWDYPWTYVAPSGQDAWSYLAGITDDAWTRMCGTEGDAWERLPGTSGDAWERLIVACIQVMSFRELIRFDSPVLKTVSLRSYING